MADNWKNKLRRQLMSPDDYEAWHEGTKQYREDAFGWKDGKAPDMDIPGGIMGTGWRPERDKVPDWLQKWIAKQAYRSGFDDIGDFVRPGGGGRGTPTLQNSVLPEPDASLPRFNPEWHTNEQGLQERYTGPPVTPGMGPQWEGKDPQDDKQATDKKGRRLMKGYVPDWLQNAVAGGADALGFDEAADYLRPGGGGRQTHGTGSGNNPMAFSQPDWMIQSGDFDPSNPEQVLKAQRMLNRLEYKDDQGEALKEDSMMGRKTESAYRQWVNDTRATAGSDTYGYDYNEGNPRKGFLGRAYQNLDKKLGGYLPGGYKRDQANMTRDEYRDR